MTSLTNQDHFALVAYVPEPLASFLYELRCNFSGAPCPQPHITILPPRPLRVSSEYACQSAKKILRSKIQFEVELSSVCCFTSTNTVYLDISEGGAEIAALHNSLNYGDLRHQEEFDFRPHLTIAGPVSPLHLTTILHQAETRWRTVSWSHRFVLSEIVCLSQAGNHPNDGWQRLWSVKLKAMPPKSITPASDLLTSADQQ